MSEAREAGSTEAVLALQREAEELFAKVEHSGESGELLLYLLLETVLGVPQLLCKMPLKTNTQMHIHGADGVHGAVLPNGNLALYWGESKLHTSYGKAIDSCFESLASFLVGGPDGPARRDLLLLRDRLDLGDKRLQEALARFLRDDTVESTCVEFRGAAMVGFNVAGYPDPREAQDDVAELTRRWLERIHEQVHSRQIASFELEVFCVPFPSVDEFRGAMRAALNLT